jgi:hypothetical protein
MPFSVFMVGCWPFSRTYPLAFDIEYLSFGFYFVACWAPFACLQVLMNMNAFVIGVVQLLGWFQWGLFLFVFCRLPSFESY